MKKDLIRKDSHTATLEQGSKVVVPAKLISLEKAVTYYNNFYNTRIAAGHSNKTRAVWFEFKQLENYFERTTTFCVEQNIEISRFVFLLGATKKGQRTVFLAPATYDEQLDLHRAFSFENGKIIYLHRFAGEDYSTITDFTELQSTEESLILSNKGTISSAKAIQLYNNYYDVVTGPFNNIVDSDTRFVWYEKGEFEGYLTYLKENCNDPSGVNIIFGVNNNNKAEGIYANRLTLFFAPTTSFENENIYDLNKNIWEYPETESNVSPMTCYFNRGSSGPPPYGWD